MVRLARNAAQAVWVSTAALGLAGLVAGAVRVLPWLLDPSVPWRVAAPFARSLAAAAAEAALLVGWPVGWSLACFRFVESGEARVLRTLGERPSETVARLAWQGAGLGVLLAFVAVLYGRDASAPGRVATELVAQGRVACEAADAPTTLAIPFTEFTWLCAPGREPRLVGAPPGALSQVVVSARDARIAGDFRSLDLDDAHVLFPAAEPVAVHVAALSMRGMAPWAAASTLSPAIRALLLASSAAVAAGVGAYLALRGAAKSRLGTLAMAATGPLSALGLIRFFERAGVGAGAFVLVPLAGGVCTLALGAGVALARQRRLR